MNDLYQVEVTDIQGKPYKLEAYQGKVLLIVNTASECGFTPQYEGLQKLHDAYHNQGLEVLGFPCNQFGHQEPGTGLEIQQFCSKNYGVTFKMHEKVEVNGDQTHPLYQQLKDQAPGIMGSKAIKWNFTKFLVNRQGDVVKRYGSTSTPDDIEKDVIALLD